MASDRLILNDQIGRVPRRLRRFATSCRGDRVFVFSSSSSQNDLSPGIGPIARFIRKAAFAADHHCAIWISRSRISIEIVRSSHFRYGALLSLSSRYNHADNVETTPLVFSVSVLVKPQTIYHHIVTTKKTQIKRYTDHPLQTPTCSGRTFGCQVPGAAAAPRRPSSILKRARLRVQDCARKSSSGRARSRRQSHA